MPVADAEHEAADADLLRLDGRGGQRRDRLEAIDVPALGRRLLKMIGDREPVEPAVISESPQLSHLVERSAEVTEMYPEPSTRSPSMGRQRSLVRPRGLLVPSAGFADVVGAAPPLPAPPQAASARPPSRVARNSARIIVMFVRPPANVSTGGRPLRIWVVLVSSLSSLSCLSWRLRVLASPLLPLVPRTVRGPALPANCGDCVFMIPRAKVYKRETLEDLDGVVHYLCQQRWIEITPYSPRCELGKSKTRTTTVPT